MKRLLSSLKTHSFCLLVMVLIAGGMLRFFRLGQVPLGYTFDEVSIAYDAWSLAEWGLDIFMRPTPKVFESLGDYKAPLMIYLAAGIYTLTGFHLAVVRWIAAIAGLVSVAAVYGIGRQLSFNSWARTAAAGLIALSPWSLQMSRTGFEVNVAVALISMGVLLFLWARKYPLLNLASSLALGLSVIAYHSPKLVVPVLLLILWGYRKHLKNLWLYAGLMLVSVGWFYWSFSFMVGPQVWNRGKQTTIFYANQSASGSNRHVLELLGKNLVSHLSLSFWVGGVQETWRHILPGFGVLLVATLILVGIGGVSLYRNRRRQWWFLASWVGAGLLPSIISTQAPHALRAALSLPPLMLLGGYGVAVMGKLTSNRAKWFRAAAVILVVMYTGHFGLYLYRYYTRFPIESARDFQYGYFEAIDKAEHARTQGERLLVTTANGNPKYHLLIRLEISPPDFHAGKFSYAEFKPIAWPDQETGQIYIATPEEIPPDDDRVVDTVTLPNRDEIVYVIAKK